MSPRARTFALVFLVAGVALGGFLFWKTFVSATQPISYREYDVSPANSFIQTANPVLVDAEKLRGPIISDEVFTALQERARSDFGVYSSLDPDPAALDEITGGDVKAMSQIAGIGEQYYPRIAGRTPERGEVTISDLTDGTAVVRIRAQYTGAADEPPTQLTYSATYNIESAQPRLIGLTIDLVGG